MKSKIPTAKYMSIVLPIEQSVIEIQNTPVILDSDVANFYGVPTKRVNEAVANNPEKFPKGYVISLSADEWVNLKSKFSTSNWGGVRRIPKAFTEKGLYMLATILKNKKATQTTLSIIEAFSRMRELGRELHQLQLAGNEKEKRPILQRSGEIIAEIFENDLDTSESETTFEVNFAVIKFKHTVKKDKKRKNG